MDFDRETSEDLPSALEDERGVLGAILTAHSMARVPNLSSTDFQTPQHSLIFRTCASLIEDGEPCDIVVLNRVLKDSGQLQAAGGPAYISGLLQTPDGHFIDDDLMESYARSVQEASARRAMIRAALSLASAARNGHAFSEIMANHRARIAHLEERPPDAQKLENATKEPSLWLSYDDLFVSALSMGEQFQTGFPTIDRCTDGGLAQGLMTVIQGRPGLGKTLLATQIALHMAPRCAVGGLFADEGLAGTRIRLGQQLGQDRTAMRRPDEASRVEAVAALRHRAVFWKFLQPRSPKATVELFASDFDALAPAGLPRVWILDSAQVLRLEGVKPTDRRIAISNLIWRVQELAEQYRAIALLVSQVNRKSYASKKADERVDDLAAGAETNAIEFASQLILHIDGDPKSSIKIRCPKNRYTGETFSLSCVVDFARSTFTEIQTDPQEPVPQRDDKRRVTVSKAIIMHLVKAYKKAAEKNEAGAGTLGYVPEEEGLSNKDLFERVQGRRDSYDEARNALVEADEIKVEKVGRAHFFRLSNPLKHL